MKKVMVAAIAAMAIGTSLSAYQLATSVYYPNNSASGGTPWNDALPWENSLNEETIEKNFAKNYLNSTFISGMADTFDRSMSSNDKAVRNAFSNRTLSAVLGFHKRAVAPLEKQGMFASGRTYQQRTSDMLDFLAIPILEHMNSNSETLDEFTTRIRKEAINKAKGKVWAGGVVRATLEAKDFRFGYSSNGQPNTKWIPFPAKLKGVQYNSFVSELLTILQVARDNNVEMKVLERMEEIARLSDDQIVSTVIQFNQKRAGRDGIDHSVSQCYGYTDDQMAAYIQAGIFMNDNPKMVKSFIDELADGQSKQLTYKPAKVFGTDQTTIAANNLKANPPQVKFSANSQCITESLKSFAPDRYAEYEKKLEETKESFFDSVWKAPFRAVGAIVSECRRQGKCSQ